MNRGAVAHRHHGGATLRRWTMMIGGMIVTWLLLISTLAAMPFAKKAAEPVYPPHWVQSDTENFAPLSEGGTILFYFWAPWCEPCVRLRDGALRDSTLGVTVGDYKLEADDPIRDQLKISGLPTAILYHNGEQVERWQADITFQFTPEIEAAILDDLHAVLDSLGGE